MLSEDLKKDIEAEIKKYPTRRSSVMAALTMAQRDKGRVTAEDMCEIADLLGINPVDVHEMGTFYTMYNVERPVGKYHIQVCWNISCSLLGAEHLIEHIEKLLGIKLGETTPDKKFTLTTVECLGSCGTAPMMQINDGERVEEILKGLD
jgi:NADH-quinone oxidoreductase E subunit